MRRFYAIVNFGFKVYCIYLAVGWALAFLSLFPLVLLAFFALALMLICIQLETKS